MKLVLIVFIAARCSLWLRLDLEISTDNALQIIYCNRAIQSFSHSIQCGHILSFHAVKDESIRFPQPFIQCVVYGHLLRFVNQPHARGRLILHWRCIVIFFRNNCCRIFKQ